MFLSKNFNSDTVFVCTVKNTVMQIFHRTFTMYIDSCVFNAMLQFLLLLLFCLTLNQQTVKKYLKIIILISHLYRCNTTAVSVPEDYLLFASHNSIRRISLQSPDRTDVFLPLPSLKNVVAVDYHYQAGRIYYTDIQAEVIRYRPLSRSSKYPAMI